MLISSKQNAKVKTLVALRQRRIRDAKGVFLIEGYREIKRAVEKKIAITELYYCPEWFLGSNEPQLLESLKNSGAELTELSKTAFEKASYRDRPDGLLAVAWQWRTGLEDLKLKSKSLIIVIEAIEKPGNLGTILRSADGAGVDAVIVCDPVTDVFNPNVVRASTGVLFSVPVVVSESKAAYNWLQQKGIKVVVTTPDANTLYTDANLTQAVALVMGSEQYGLSDFWLGRDSLAVSIPMLGQADSLNVATSAAIVAYEAVRQRSGKPKDKKVL